MLERQQGWAARYPLAFKSPPPHPACGCRQVVGHTKRTCETLKDSFLEQFAVASAASALRAGATDQLVLQAAADQEADKQRVAALVSLARDRATRISRERSEPLK